MMVFRMRNVVCKVLELLNVFEFDVIELWFVCGFMIDVGNMVNCLICVCCCVVLII